MSVFIDGSEPAFPYIDSGCGRFEPGMSRRDWLAGMALQGWLAGPCQGDALNDFPDDDGGKAFAEHQLMAARACYGYADAMIAAGKEGA